MDQKGGMYMVEVVCTQTDKGQTLEKYLTKTFPYLPKSMMYKAIRNKKIKVNRKRTENRQILNEGDVITLFLPDDALRTKKWDLGGNADLDIVYEDENILVVNKPFGLLSQKDDQGNQDCLDARVKNYLYQSGQWDPEADRAFIPAVAHRLDRNTTGLVMAGKNSPTARKLAGALRSHTLGKYYKAKVEGEIQQPVQIRLWLKKEDRTAKVVCEGTPGAQYAETIVTPLEDGWVECDLKTGRFHQIRASLASIGHPLAGDKKYGSREKGPYRLQAYKLDLTNVDIELADENRIIEIDSAGKRIP